MHARRSGQTILAGLGGTLSERTLDPKRLLEGSRLMSWLLLLLNHDVALMCCWRKSFFRAFLCSNCYYGSYKAQHLGCDFLSKLSCTPCITLLILLVAMKVAWRWSMEQNSGCYHVRGWLENGPGLPLLLGLRAKDFAFLATHPDLARLGPR